MRKALSTPVLLLAGLALSGALSAQVSDDFSDGDFTADPVWSGDDALFTVDAGQLRSNSPGAANYQLSTPSTQAAEAQWELFVDLKFSTSGANYVDVYLMSDNADLASGVNGYYVRMGGTQDRLELFRSNGGTATSLIVSPDGIVNSSSDNPFRIRVKRDVNDLWTLDYDDGATGTYLTAGTATDATHGSSTHFGIRIEQSSAAGPINNHFFDDILVGAIPVDLTPPQVVSVTAISDVLVDVLFDEPLDPATAGDANNYDIQPFIGVNTAVLDGTDPALVHLTPALALTSGNTYDLQVSGVEDLAGNALPAGAPIPFSYFVPDVAQFRDVTINELMADPTPVVGLPEAEFIELHNATPDKFFDLNGWTISDGGTPAALPAATLGPGEFVILTTVADAPLFTGFGTVLAVPGFPALNNSGDPLVLTDDNGTTIDAVTYDLSWFNDAVKDDGGWTLEQIDPTTPCSRAANWTASNAGAGGTPGAQNSVYAIVPDNDPPVLISVQVNGPSQVVLVFNEALDTDGIGTAGYTIDPFLDVAQAVPGPQANTVVLDLNDQLVVGEVYTVTVTGLTDCPGNPIGGDNSAVFGLPEAVLPGDLVINEVLYDPRVGGSDFVELYNRSGKVLGLAGLRMANEEDGQIANPIVITQASVLILPGEYILLTEDPANIAAEYPQSRTDRFLLCDLPSYNNGEGTVVLQDPQGNTLDLFRYTDDLHFPLINETEGVSLERVDPARASDEPTNWHSAAETAGWATPGFLNSQFSEAPEPSGEMTIEPAIFSPDNDGYQDLLTIRYRFNEPGFVGTLGIYDLAGREVRRLLENTLLGADGAVSWDGVMEGGEKARVGPYVVVFEAYDLAGNVEKYRGTVTLAHRFE